MDIYESIISLTWDPDGVGTGLLNYGDALADPGVRLDGSQLVQQVDFLRALGSRMIPRGNERHSLEVTIAEPEATHEAAFISAMNHITGAPRGGGDLLIALEDGHQWRLKNAAVESWPGSTDGRMTARTLRITGGEIVLTNGAGGGNEYIRPAGAGRYLRPA